MAGNKPDLNSNGVNTSWCEFIILFFQLQQDILRISSKHTTLFNSTYLLMSESMNISVTGGSSSYHDFDVRIVNLTS